MTVLRRLRPPPMDALLAVTLLLVAQANVWIGLDSYEAGSSQTLDAFLAPFATLPLAWRRQAPVLVLLIVAGAFFLPDLVVLTGVPFWGEYVPFLVAVYSATVHGSRRADVVVFATGTAGLLILAARRADFRGVGAYAFWFGFLGVAWAAGHGIRILRERAGTLEAHARDLEEDGREEARRAVGRERRRIARELHDVIAHHVSVMVVQAGGAERMLDADTDEAREALRNVQAAGREALEEMEMLLGVLRDDEAPSRAPVPTLRRLDTLVEEMRGAGMEVELVVQGTPRRVSPALDRSAYRIAQEALTNALKHAPRASVAVRVSFSVHSLGLEVADTGDATARPRGGRGYGLVGMRERVSLHGGSLQVGRRDGAGFVVRADFPLDGTRP